MGAGSVCVSWNCTSDTTWSICALTCWWKLKRISKNWEFLSFLGCTTKPCYVHFCPCSNSRSCLEVVSFWTWNPWGFFLGNWNFQVWQIKVEMRKSHLFEQQSKKSLPKALCDSALPGGKSSGAFWEPEFVGRKMDQIGGGVRGEGGIWCLLEDLSFPSSLKCCWSWGGNVCTNFQGLFCHKELLWIDLLNIFLPVINPKGPDLKQRVEGQIKKTQFEDSRSNGFVSMRKLIFFFFLLLEKFCFTFQSSITSMDSFMYFQVAFGFLLPVFSLFFSWSKCKTPCLDSLRFDLVINLLIFYSRLWIL